MDDSKRISPPADQSASESRREFLHTFSLAAPLLLLGLRISAIDALAAKPDAAYNAREHYYGMGIDVSKCIGCGRCADACKTENNVPREPYYFRTWVERYVIAADGETMVDSPNGGIGGFPPPAHREGHPAHLLRPQAVQPVRQSALRPGLPGGRHLRDRRTAWCWWTRTTASAAATASRPAPTAPGTSTRRSTPRTSAPSATTAWSRACCPPASRSARPGARVFGELRQRSSPLARFMRFNEIQVLKPQLNTEPKVYYANLDGEVR